MNEFTNQHQVQHPTQPSHIWAFTQFVVPGNRRFTDALDTVIRRALSHCSRCLSIYEQLHAIPCSCPFCQSSRGLNWLDEMERQAGREMLEITGN